MREQLFNHWVNNVAPGAYNRQELCSINCDTMGFVNLNPLRHCMSFSRIHEQKFQKGIITIIAAIAFKNIPIILWFSNFLRRAAAACACLLRLQSA